MEVRFVDANVFIYAMLKTKRKLTADVVAIKSAAETIMGGIDRGDKKVATSVVHLSEVANVVSTVAGIPKANAFLDYVYERGNIDVFEVDKNTYQLANELSKRIGIGVNDCLAYVLMRNNRIAEIYSFDKGFDKIQDISRVSVE